MSVKLSAAKAAGENHINNNLPCQDAVMAFQQDDISIIALCDGAGSSAAGGIGAERTIITVCKNISSNWDTIYGNIEVGKQNILDDIRKNLFELGGDITDYASTLLFLAVKGREGLFGQIGDGVILRRHNNENSIISLPENGDYANETFFTTDYDAINHFRLNSLRVDEGDDFMLLCDGSSSILVDTASGEIADNCNIIMDCNIENDRESTEKELTEMLENSFRSRTDDDISICLMHIGN